METTTRTIQKPKPVRAYLRELPDEYRDLALANNEAAAAEIDKHKHKGPPALKQFEMAKTPNRYMALKRAFSWKDSPEGHDFWKDKAKQLYEEESMSVQQAIEMSDESIRKDLKKYTDNVYEGLPEELKTTYLTSHFPTYAHFLRYAFPWDKTKQGGQFWADLYEMYAGDLPLEPEDVK